MTGIREFLNTPAGKVVSAVVVAVCLGIAAYAIWTQTGPSEAGAMSQDRVFIDAETGKPFEHTLRVGQTIPVLAPSGKQTGFPAERCFWNADGTTRSTPTFVLLNNLVNKEGPTFCPDCSRLVVGHNPVPGSGVEPPPTQAEYKPSPERDGR